MHGETIKIKKMLFSVEISVLKLVIRLKIKIITN